MQKQKISSCTSKRKTILNSFDQLILCYKPKPQLPAEVLAKIYSNQSGIANHFPITIRTNERERAKHDYMKLFVLHDELWQLLKIIWIQISRNITPSSAESLLKKSWM